MIPKDKRIGPYKSESAGHPQLDPYINVYGPGVRKVEDALTCEDLNKAYWTGYTDGFGDGY